MPRTPKFPSQQFSCFLIVYELHTIHSDEDKMVNIKSKEKEEVKS